MLSKCRPHSILTVQFKNQLSSHLPPSSSYKSGSTQYYPITHLTRSLCSSQLHSLVIKSGVCENLGTQNHILHLYAKCGEVWDACKLFDEMPVRNVVSWNTMIRMGVTREFDVGSRVQLGLFCENLATQNHRLPLYAKCGEVWDAGKLFDEMPVRNVVSWNTMIRMGVTREFDVVSRVQLGFCYFRRMLMGYVFPDSTTMNTLIRACVELSDLRISRQLHCFVVKIGLNTDRFVGSAAVDLYGKSGLIKDARYVFDEIRPRDLVSWNVMLSAYSLNRLPEEALGIFRLMQSEGITGDEFTFSIILSSCSFIPLLGQQFHSLITKMSYNLDTQVATALLDVYSKTGLLDSARLIFNTMSSLTRVSWNSMIVGYGQHGHAREALTLFVEMCRKNVAPDEITLASIVNSCGNLSAIGEITQIHAYITKQGFDAHLSVTNALIVAYSNCGTLETASRLFSSVVEPDLVSFTSIITAYASHGRVYECLRIFDTMLSSGLIPDNVAFLSVLSACTHAGLIAEGLHYFKLMLTNYNIIPNSELKTCLVDLLARAGLVEEASGVSGSDPGGLGSSSLGALAGSCLARGDVKMAQWAAERLFELEPDNAVNYTQMASMYAAVGQWNEAARVRKMMKDRCSSSKVPGCSWVEIGGKVHSFVCGDTAHPLAMEVYEVLRGLFMVLKEDDCVKTTTTTTFDVGSAFAGSGEI